MEDLIYAATEEGNVFVWMNGMEIARLSTCCGTANAITVYNGVVCCALNSASRSNIDVTEDIELFTKVSMNCRRI